MPDPAPPPAPAPDEPPPVWQRLFDNVFLLLVLGVAVMAVVYTAWGWWEIHSLPKGTLP